MTEERDSDLQDWFTRSAEPLPSQPFAWEVLAKVQGREQKLKLQLYAAWLVAAFGFSLLLPRLLVLFDWLAALPLAVGAGGIERWPLLVLLAGLGWWLVRRARNAGLP